MQELLLSVWPVFLFVADLLVAIPASAHAVMRKRDTRAAIAWVGLIWLTPLIGSVLYFCFGINRIRRRGHRLRQEASRTGEAADTLQAAPATPWASPPFDSHDNIQGLAALVGKLTERPLLSGNQVQPLHGGDEIFTAMLAAIEAAEHSVAMVSYIFDNDRVGRRFVDVLAAAVGRGLQVRVLLDDVGVRYSHPPIYGELARRGVPVASFLPTRIPRMFHYANLRNHRKILVLDGRTGFTGGTNIREGNQLSLRPQHPVQDIHFRLAGPVVSQMQQVFAFDWEFSTEEVLAGDIWFPPAGQMPRAGDMWARGITDGPDEDFEKLRLTILGAISAAQSKVQVVTPYFLPDASLITALLIAAMRGVEVDIVLPEENNIVLVQWATRAMLWQVLERGCRVWATPPPFDHSKLLLVDGLWTLLGSTNWDPRSLRLNFEFNVECYSADLAAQLSAIVEWKIAAARPVTWEEVEGRNTAVRLRDGVARLLSPFL